MKWAAARTFVLANIQWRMETYSPDFMQTFPSPGPGMSYNTVPAARVNRRPIGGDVYVIAAEFYCGNPYGCSPHLRNILDAFNRSVSGAP
jgi:hypothetical protein